MNITIEELKKNFPREAAGALEVATYVAEAEEDRECDSKAYVVNRKDCAEYLEVYADVEGTEADRADVVALRVWITRNHCNVIV